MMENSENIEEILNSRLYNAETSADGISWNDFLNRKKKKRFTLWLKVAVVMVAVFIFSVAVFLIESPRNEKVTQQSGGPVRKQANGDAGTKQNFDKSGNNVTVRKPDFKKVMGLKNEWDYRNSNSTKVDFPDQIEDENTRSFRYSLMVPSKGIRLHKIESDLNAGKIVKPEILYSFSSNSRTWSNGLYWQFKAGTGINLPRLTVSDLGKYFIHKNYKEIRQNSEKGIASFGLQVSLGKRIDKWMFSTGLGFSHFELRGNYNFTYSEKPIIDRDGRIVNYAQSVPELISFTSKQKISFVEIPVSVQYRIGKLKSKEISVSLSYVPQFLNNISGDLPNSTLLNERDQLRNVNFRSATSAIEFGIPMLFQTGNYSGIAIMPHFRYNFGLRQAQLHYSANYHNWGLVYSYLTRF